MPMPVDPITRRKLVLVRQLYQQAEKQSSLPHSSVSRIMAIIGFDLTVETLLKAIVGALMKLRLKPTSVGVESRSRIWRDHTAGVS